MFFHCQWNTTPELRRPSFVGHRRRRLAARRLRLDALDRVRAEEGASRSEFFGQVIRARLDEHGRGAAQRYVEGYSTRPETDDEIAAARASAFALLGAEPWG